MPSTRSPDGAASSSSAFSTVSSSGARSSGHARALLAALDVRPVAADAEHDPASPIGSELTARASISVEVGDERVQARVAVAAAEVEVPQPVDPLLVAGGDPVEVVLHLRREVVVDEPAEVLLEQAVTAKARNDGTSAVPRLKT